MQKSSRMQPPSAPQKIPIDAVALQKWDEYTMARDVMLLKTDFEHAPWHVVRTDDKRKARLNVLGHIIRSIDCLETDKSIAAVDPDVVIDNPGQQLDRLAR